MEENAKSKDLYRSLRIVVVETQDDASTSKSLRLESQNNELFHIGIILSGDESHVQCDAVAAF